jgi:purine-binding chemotaxis protein CheW
MPTAELVDDLVIQAATFYVGDLLLGIDIRHVREINHLRSYTRVPQAGTEILGVVNLRGEVVTVLDLRRLLDLAPGEVNRRRRIVVVNDGRECVGLLVDSVADILTIDRDALEARPENIDLADARFVRGVCLLKQGLLVLLDVREVLDTRRSTRPSAE